MCTLIHRRGGHAALGRALTSYLAWSGYHMGSTTNSIRPRQFPAKNMCTRAYAPAQHGSCQSKSAAVSTRTLGTVVVTVGTVLGTVLGTVVNYPGTVGFFIGKLDLYPFK